MRFRQSLLWAAASLAVAIASPVREKPGNIFEMIYDNADGSPYTSTVTAALPDSYVFPSEPAKPDELSKRKDGNTFEYVYDSTTVTKVVNFPGEYVEPTPKPKVTNNYHRGPPS